MGRFLHLTIPQSVAESYLLTEDIDGARAVLSATTTFTSIGASFGGIGAPIGFAIGLVTGFLTAWFGDQKERTIRVIRQIFAEVMAQFDPEATQYRGENLAVSINRPADPGAVYELGKQTIKAIRDNFEAGSNDYQDLTRALQGLRLEEYPPACNCTICVFQVQDNGITGILQPGGILLLISAYFFVRG